MEKEIERPPPKKVDVIETVELRKSYGDVEALRGLSFKFSSGVMGLLGPNGAGKSTFIKIAMGLLKADGGVVRIFGEEMSEDRREIKRWIGYMPEGRCLPEALTGVQLVYSMGILSGLPRKEAFYRTHAVLDFVGMGEQRYRPISSYSVGMQQRVKLAQAIVHDPMLIFLDEPTSGLDPFGREEILKLVQELKRVGKSIVLSTHILRDVERVADEVVVINRGELVAKENMKMVMRRGGWMEVSIIGNPEKLLEKMEERGWSYTLLGSKIKLKTLNQEEVLEFMKMAEESGVTVRSLRSGVRDLKDLFTDLMKGGGEVA
ncbi:MAG: ABC transporter ATP-binding protein [Thermoplasmata archaeon]|nr:ABC transporter ATP-binding protein [Thermoplasmata archaeon]